MNDGPRNLFWNKAAANNGLDEKLEVKPISVDTQLWLMFMTIYSGKPERALNRLRELESQMLNKTTLKLYLDALEQVVAATTAVKKLLDNCAEDEKRQIHAASN